ncbi:hypothetical protein [Xanthomonas translucens]|uniref:hypothetical protein n=1 Tax=Xanthomonas campestris pv. translucens TaxID=343 RepID=UPI0012D9ADFA|nr:hypothetical protein [Xanthomonas translucens]
MSETDTLRTPLIKSNRLSFAKTTIRKLMRIMCEDRWLNRNIWDAGASQVFLAALVLAVSCFALENLCEASLDWILTFIGVPSRLDFIKEDQAIRPWISPLLISPMLENFICFVWLHFVFYDKKWHWWKGPLLVSLIAGVFHSLFNWEMRYMAICVVFFAICCLLANVHDRIVGFLASVLLHSAFNLVAMAFSRFS